MANHHRYRYQQFLLIQLMIMWNISMRATVFTDMRRKGRENWLTPWKLGSKADLGRMRSKAAAGDAQCIPCKMH
jgi:hypothetical protein